MTKANDLASLLDANGDVVSSALDNVPASDLVNDTTPQLGGNLDLNSNNITGTGNLDVTGTVTADGVHSEYNGVSDNITSTPTASGVQIGSFTNGYSAVEIAGTSGGFIDFSSADGTDFDGRILYAHSDNFMQFNTNGSEAMRITSSGSVDISNSSGATLKLTSTDVTGADTELLGQIDFVSSDTSGGSAGTQARIKGVYEDNGDSSGLAFLTGYSTGSGSPTINEVMRLRHEGTVLVGKTSSGYNVDGFETHQNGETYVSRSGTPFAINRNSSDGTLLNLYKNGSTVGSIGSRAGVASYIVLDPRNATGNGGSGLTGVGDVIRPTNYTGGQTDNHVSLGSSAARFKDLYLSGGVYLGGTSSAHALDDYEEVSFTATLGGSGGQPSPPLTVAGFATKIGRVVQYSIGFENLNTTGYSGQINITGLPFANAGGRAMGNFVGYVGATWTGNDNFTELGVGQTVLNVYTIGSASPWTGTTHNAGLHSRYFWATGTYITS